eukprot:332675_1
MHPLSILLHQLHLIPLCHQLNYLFFSPITNIPSVSPTPSPLMNQIIYEEEVVESTASIASIYSTEPNEFGAIGSDMGELEPLYYVLFGVGGTLICVLCVILCAFCVYQYRKRTSIKNEVEIKALGKEGMEEGVSPPNTGKHPIKHDHQGNDDDVIAVVNKTAGLRDTDDDIVAAVNRTAQGVEDDLDVVAVVNETARDLNVDQVQDESDDQDVDVINTMNVTKYI